MEHPYRSAPFTRDWPPRHIPLLYRLRLLFAEPRLIWLLRHGRYTIARKLSEHYEQLLYDPAWPDHATLLKHLPGAPAIHEDGTIELTASAWFE